MNTYIECYRQYIHHFKSGFPYVSAQSFNEGETNMRITIMTCQIRRVTRGRGERFPSQKSKLRFNREKARFNQDEYNFNGINRDLSEILS